MQGLWKCPRCGRTFRQVSQTHSCGVGSRSELLHGKPDNLVRLYRQMEKSLQRLEGVEIVMRGRYALFRTTRIFADLVFMKDALRLMVLLDREVRDPQFFKIGRMSAHRVAHVAKIRTAAELRAVKPYLLEAHRFALRERPKSDRSAARAAPGRSGAPSAPRRSAARRATRSARR